MSAGQVDGLKTMLRGAASVAGGCVGLLFADKLEIPATVTSSLGSFAIMSGVRDLAAGGLKYIQNCSENDGIAGKVKQVWNRLTAPRVAPTVLSSGIALAGGAAGGFVLGGRSWVLPGALLVQFANQVYCAVTQAAPTPQRAAPAPAPRVALPQPAPAAPQIPNYDGVAVEVGEPAADKVRVVLTDGTSETTFHCTETVGQQLLDLYNQCINQGRSHNEIIHIIRLGLARDPAAAGHQGPYRGRPR